MSEGTLKNLEHNLRDSLRRDASDPAKQAAALQVQRQAWEQTKQQVLPVPPDVSASLSQHTELKAAERTLKDKEAEIAKRKADVEQRVKAQTNRVVEEGKKLEQLRRELDTMEDPTKKEVAELRKKIEAVDRELRPMKALCERKEKELKEAVAVYNDKSAQKTELVGRLFERVTESERTRMTKLDELNRLLQSMEGRSNGQ